MLSTDNNNNNNTSSSSNNKITNNKTVNKIDNNKKTENNKTEKKEKDLNELKREMKIKAEKKIKPKKTQEQKDHELITSLAVINRIKWDEKLSLYLNQILIGHLDRFEGIKKSTIKEFEIEEIPYHRIYLIYFRNRVIWDREKRIDNVSKGKLEMIIEEEEKKRIELEELKRKLKEEAENNLSNGSSDSDNDDNDEENNENAALIEEENETQNMLRKKVIFSRSKVRKAQKEYIPEDDLERWLVENNEDNYILVLDHPTHISQRGGHYHIIYHTKEKYDEYIKAWKDSIEKKQKFYVEELRTKHAFKLYIDIDLKLTKQNSPLDIVKAGWIKSIQQFTDSYFNHEKDITLILTECHSNWNDKVNDTAKFKSGYRLYYPNIIVDFDKFCDYTYQLCFYLKDIIGTYEYQPEDWTFEDVIDLKTCNHPRCRLFGTTKWRRGHLLPRIYDFRGVFDKTAELNVDKTNELKQDLTKLLPLTSTRVEDPFDE
ncbi:hypothetical protein ABK040_012478 [Willaertia magna]